MQQDMLHELVLEQGRLKSLHMPLLLPVNLHMESTVSGKKARDDNNLQREKGKWFSWLHRLVKGCGPKLSRNLVLPMVFI